MRWIDIKTFMLLPAFAIPALGQAIPDSVGYESISHTEMIEHVENIENDVIIDVRAKKGYAKGRIPGAIHIFVDSIEAGPHSLPYPKDTVLIFYCNGPG